jgi:hypothetical protein
MMQIILRAAAADYQGSIPRVGADCNNNRVVIHGNSPNTLLSTNQTQADLLRVFKNLVATEKFPVKYKYVQSHADESKKWRDCSLKELINIKVDSLAKKALKAANSTREFITANFPHEQVWIENGRQKNHGTTACRARGLLGQTRSKKIFQ